jgi:rhomboid protease GluP
MSNKVLGAVVCSSCRRLISREEKKCPYCGAHQPILFGLSPGLHRFFLQVDISDIVIWTCGALYIISLILTALIDVDTLLRPSSFLSIGSPSSLALILMGGVIHETFFEGMVWTLLCGSWLHGGILHIGFNMWWARDLLRLSSALLGSARTTSVWIASGVGGMLAAALTSDGVTIGASTSLYGIMGCLGIFGWRRGGVEGTRIRDMVVRWIFLSTIYTLMMSNVSHAGHFGGLVAGAGIAFLLPKFEGQIETRRPQLIALGLVVLTILAFLVQGVAGFVLFSQLPPT